MASTRVTSAIIVQTAFGGSAATTLYEFNRQFNVNVKAAPEFRNTIEAVKDAKIAFANANGNGYIPLTDVADVTLDTGASYIYHERGNRFIPVKFSVRDRDLGGAVEEAKARIAENVKLPPGYRLLWAGEFEELEAAQKRLEVIVPISIALILILLYGLFNSLRDSLLTLTGIPFSVAGGILALWLAGENFSISAAIGFVSLFGVSVMDGILMMSFYNEVHKSGASSREAMFEAATQRMRPMLMTALSAAIGLFPAALSTGIGSQVQRPLATVVVGGMLIGPLMLLIVVPALRLLFLGEDEAAHKEPEKTEA